MNSRDVDITDIPQTVLDEVESGLRRYFVPILGHWKRRGKQELRLIGSGTLISLGDRGYILTAAHVWQAATGAEKLHLFMMAGPARVEILYAHISPKVIWNQQGPEEWGPDLALLELPQPQISSIKAHKSFLSFAHQQADLSDHPPKLKKGLWAVYGLVGEFSETVSDQELRSFDVSLNAQAFICGITQTYTRDGFDYYDTRADLWLPGVPASFGGVSGGGLWQVDLSVSKSSGEFSWDGKRHFRGVAFWESPITAEQRIVRCHGPRSVFERGPSEFGLRVS